ncbi:MAG: hypothetical protein MUE85_14415 [Microscillaceae bacterium]|nr:hypothetical protein [Microscillaceae bacterium]
MVSWSCLLFAQKATFKKDTVYKDGKPYALFKAKGSAIMGQDYSLQTLSGKEVAYFKLEGEGGKGQYIVVFRESGKKGYMPIYENRKSISKEVVANDMVGAEGINPEGERLFLQLYEKDLMQKGSNPIINIFGSDSNNGGDLNPVERERRGEVKVFGNTIQQNFTDIGAYEKDRDTERGGYIFVIKLPSGGKVVEAIWIDKSQTCQLVTFKDNKKHAVYLDKTTFDSDVAQQIAAFLVDRNYL